MKHVIKYPVAAERFDPSSPLKTIVWDDEAGTVEGDHPRVPLLSLVLDADTDIPISRPWGAIILDDVRHDARQFLCLLTDPDEFQIDPRAILPDSLKGIKPLSPLSYGPLPDDAFG